MRLLFPGRWKFIFNWDKSVKREQLYWNIMDKDTKGRPRNGGCWQQIKAEYQAPGKCGIFSLFCCPGFPKGIAPWHTTLLAKCSVLYALSALLRKWGCRPEGQAHLKQQENRAVIAWRGAASAGLVSAADRAYMKAPSLVLCRTMGQSVPAG